MEEFITDNFNTKEKSFEDFEESFGKTIEKPDTEEPPEMEPEVEEQINLESKEPEITKDDIISEENKQVFAELNKLISDVGIDTLDDGVSFVASRISKSDKTFDPKYNIPQKDKKLLKQALDGCLPTNKRIMPPWLILIVFLCATVGMIMFKAYQDGQERERTKALEDENKRMQEEIEAMKAKEIERIKKAKERKKAKRNLRIVNETTQQGTTN